MHNSQNGSKMVYVGTSGATAWAGWNGTALQGGLATTTPQASLLVSDCVGCHTSTTADTIITLGSFRVPIVFNTQPPTAPLAGGNFYWVALAGGDAYGHNVRGISARDVALTLGAPGSFGCGNSCHTSLTLTDVQTGGRKNGCQGCHTRVKHHGSDPAGVPVGEEGGYYRFLGSPNDTTGHDMWGGGVSGIEDPNWEQNPTASTHNFYYGGTGADDELPTQSMGKFCAGCHSYFHSPGAETFYTDNGGGANPWFRHPSDYIIPASGEYVEYATYDPSVPVARTPLTSANPSKVTPGEDKVFCLSCHRAHGSQYKDMLRWNYSSMEPGTTNVTVAGTGCFKCHADKDDVP